MVMRTRAGLLGVLALLLLVQPAEADKRKAKEYFNAGRAAFTVEQFDLAIENYQKGYQEAQDPSFLYNIGLAHARAGRPEKAIEFFKKFLVRTEEKADRLAAEKHISDLEQQIKNRATADPAAKKDEANLAPTATQPDLMIAGKPAPASETRPLWKRWPLWVGVAAGVVVVSLAVGLGVGLSGPSESKLPTWDLR